MGKGVINECENVNYAGLLQMGEERERKVEVTGQTRGM